MYNFSSTFELASINDKARLGLLSDLHFGNSSLVKAELQRDLERMDQAECEIAINGDDDLTITAIVLNEVVRPEIIRVGHFFPVCACCHCPK